ncbi:hypothetical protein CIT31_03810 [Mesorhizobium wenxiniae]|uniref:Uncharacterized protein n=1 Tax=Mesorhizobium wenxiniae TaxID=2014805 RepID=A0A271KP85_9HYPH|nr:hypothetical protein CIT31_03810 [Mesorhizobium wenxiniae]
MSYAIQDTPDMVQQHYGRFLPQDKATIAAQVIRIFAEWRNTFWSTCTIRWRQPATCSGTGGHLQNEMIASRIARSGVPRK